MVLCAEPHGVGIVSGVNIVLCMAAIHLLSGESPGVNVAFSLPLYLLVIRTDWTLRCQQFVEQRELTGRRRQRSDGLPANNITLIAIFPFDP